MKLTESDAVYAANKFIDYYSQFNRIDDYLRFVKKDRIQGRSGSLFGLVPANSICRCLAFIFSISRMCFIVDLTGFTVLITF